MPSVILAEDAALVRAGLTEILRRGGYGITAAVGDADALESAVAASRPDIVITDVRMPPDFKDEGMRAALRLRGRWPGLPVLVLSQYIATPYAARLFGAESARDGGLGYLLKDRVGDVTEFLDAVGRVTAGGTVLDPEVVRSMVDVQRDALAALTPREREVLALMAEGLSNQAIAGRLVVTEAAVTKHIGNIFLKLDLPPEGSNRRVLAVLAHLRAGNH